MLFRSLKKRLEWLNNTITDEQEKILLKEWQNSEDSKPPPSEQKYDADTQKKFALIRYDHWRKNLNEQQLLEILDTGKKDKAPKKNEKTDEMEVDSALAEAIVERGDLGTKPLFKLSDLRQQLENSQKKCPGEGREGEESTKIIIGDVRTTSEFEGEESDEADHEQIETDNTEEKTGQNELDLLISSMSPNFEDLGPDWRKIVLTRLNEAKAAEAEIEMTYDRIDELEKNSETIEIGRAHV